jgi:lipoprotein-anchoring transpeptidase ErfK/SrfK
VSRRAALVAGGLLVAAAIGVAALLMLHRSETAAPPSKPTPIRHAPKLEHVSELAARVLPGKPVALRASPGGRILARVGSRTEFGSPQTLEVAFREGDWIAVRSPALGNKKVGWVREKPLRLVGRTVRIEVDLSKRTLTLFAHGVVDRRDAVAIGSPETPTPTGDFYVTDKLPGARFGTYYGCCILALSGRQPNLPKGWSGGDRLAIHGTPVADFGQAVTNGCLHLPGEVLQFLMTDVPLGTPVRIHA